MIAGKQVRLLLADGTPGGLLTAEIMNWTGHVVAAPRSDLAELLKRPDAGRTGVYILLGDDPESVGGQRAYIGESDDVGIRLSKHAREKEFWHRAVVHQQGRQPDQGPRSLLGEPADRARHCSGSGHPRQRHRTATGRPAGGGYLRYGVLHRSGPDRPARLGINLLRGRPMPAPATSPAHPVESPIFVYEIPRKGLCATAQVVDGEFTLLAGSVVAKEVRASARYSTSTANAYAGYEALHRKLRDDGSVRVDGTNAITTRNIVFSSPSTAGAIVAGRSCNGRQSWQTEDGMTYGAWENQGIADVPG